MEKLPALRHFSKRTILCFYLIPIAFITCALFTFFNDPQHGPDYDNLAFIREDHPPFSHFANQSTISSLNQNRPSTLRTKHEKQLRTKYVYLQTTTSTTDPTSTTDICRSDDVATSKLVLLWTPFFDGWDYMSSERFRKCEGCRNCRVTRDRTLLQYSDAVIFHARDMSAFDLPSVRRPHQRWIFFCLESPSYSDFQGMDFMRSMFNWTMTYRRDSDIVAPYGSVRKIKPPRPFDPESLRWTFANKTKSAVWMCSHCPTIGNRDAFVTELARHIDVDVFGSCGTRVCPRGETERCFGDFARDYKFFLAFENSICEDYITEKFFRTLAYDVVPVVFGGAKYEGLLPPGSYIDALSFKSPKHLAFFLAGVGKNFKMYSSYFQWRRDYAVSTDSSRQCDLCSKLHKDTRTSSYVDIREWWVERSHCRVWRPKR